eukprot:6049403-Pyramimonas_sp.AAC.1
MAIVCLEGASTTLGCGCAKCVVGRFAEDRADEHKRRPTAVPANFWSGFVVGVGADVVHLRHQAACPTAAAADSGRTSKGPAGIDMKPPGATSPPEFCGEPPGASSWFQGS